MSSPINDININMNTEDEIKEIFEQNKVSDLKRFIRKRQCLNGCNICMSYMFYFVQSAGILATTIGTGYSIKELIWSGIGLNIVASLCHSYEQVNNNISTKLFKNIQNIRNNSYVDEDTMATLDESTKKDEKNKT
jgi:hypothetical protein